MAGSTVSPAAAPTRAAELGARLAALPGVARILGELEGAGSAFHVHKLTGSAKALLAAELRRRTGRPVLYLAPTEERAEAARGDLELFLGERVLHLAEPLGAPYDIRTPHTETVAQRLDALVHLACEGDGVVVAGVRGLMEQVPSPVRVREHLVTLALGDAVDLDALLTRLTYLGYNRARAVE